MAVSTSPPSSLGPQGDGVANCDTMAYEPIARLPAVRVAYPTCGLQTAFLCPHSASRVGPCKPKESR